jgi:hypothetical protein
VLGRSRYKDNITAAKFPPLATCCSSDIPTLLSRKLFAAWQRDTTEVHAQCHRSLSFRTVDRFRKRMIARIPGSTKKDLTTAYNLPLHNCMWAGCRDAFVLPSDIREWLPCSTRLVPADTTRSAKLATFASCRGGIGQSVERGRRGPHLRLIRLQ